VAISYKVLGQAKPTADTATTLYTVPTGSGNYAVVSSLVINNLTQDLTAVRVAIRPAGATLEDKHYIVYGSTVSAFQSQVYTIGITIASTDVVTVYDSAGKCSFNLFGSENS
jgi:secreted protein with Ig-like and vWFA domain